MSERYPRRLPSSRPQGPTCDGAAKRASPEACQRGTWLMSNGQRGSTRMNFRRRTPSDILPPILSIQMVAYSILPRPRVHLPGQETDRIVLCPVDLHHLSASVTATTLVAHYVLRLTALLMRQHVELRKENLQFLDERTEMIWKSPLPPTLQDVGKILTAYVIGQQPLNQFLRPLQRSRHRKIEQREPS